jgi:hypothetical protein
MESGVAYESMLIRHTEQKLAVKGQRKERKRGKKCTRLLIFFVAVRREV